MSDAILTAAAAAAKTAAAALVSVLLPKQVMVSTYSCYGNQPTVRLSSALCGRQAVTRFPGNWTE